MKKFCLTCRTSSRLRHAPHERSHGLNPVRVDWRKWKIFTTTSNCWWTAWKSPEDFDELTKGKWKSQLMRESFVKCGNVVGRRKKKKKNENNSLFCAEFYVWFHLVRSFPIFGYVRFVFKLSFCKTQQWHETRVLEDGEVQLFAASMNCRH